VTRLIDISPPLRVGMGVFPGDATYQASQTCSIGPGCPVNVGSIAMSTHCGAHADAPLHYDSRGASIDRLELGDFIGPARGSTRVVPARSVGLKRSQRRSAMRRHGCCSG
jgi:arylformamidase